MTKLVRKIHRDVTSEVEDVCQVQFQIEGDKNVKSKPKRSSY